MKIHRGNFESNISFLKKTDLLRQGLKILEIGSGTGFFVDYLRKEGVDIVGTEINKEYIQYAKTNYDVDLMEMEGKRMNFADASFDAIISFDVFEHIPNTDEHLKEVYRLLKPGGVYAFGTPNKITNIPFEIIKEKSFTKWKEYHCSLHTYREMKKRLRNNSFSVEFIDVSVVNDFFKIKLRKFTGIVGLYLLKIINPDMFPLWLRTNFYVLAKK